MGKQQTERTIAITVTETRTSTAHVTASDLGRAIMGEAWQRCGGNFDDAGCDWYTHEGGVYINGEPGWQVSADPEVAALVDAANILINGQRMTGLKTAQPEPANGDMRVSYHDDEDFPFGVEYYHVDVWCEVMDTLTDDETPLRFYSSGEAEQFIRE